MSAAAPDSRPATGAAKPKLTGGTRRSSTKSARSRAREFALQGLYQFIVGGGEAGAIDAFTRELSGFHKADSAHYDALLHGCIELQADLDALIVPLLDRKLAEISPIERACMWMGSYEFLRCPDVPWRVVLNEYIELAKDFGGTDGHKYVNAVLNGIAPSVRPHEVAADRAAGKAGQGSGKTTGGPAA
ncbi:MAG: transcription antitermination factor NusB [Comamonadaceae bacterium]|nr:transcription antitermination factor NusB [Comamonadaceae bacterium]